MGAPGHTLPHWVWACHSGIALTLPPTHPIQGLEGKWAHDEIGKTGGRYPGPRFSTPLLPPYPDGEGSPRATRGQSSPIFIIISLNHHPLPIIKNKDGFFVVVFLLLLPPSTHSEEGSEVGERVGAVGAWRGSHISKQQKIQHLNEVGVGAGSPCPACLACPPGQLGASFPFMLHLSEWKTRKHNP